jgi:tetratricopeptide (TPR) repeat protein
MRWQQTEFLLKGVYLGLLLFLALLGPAWADLAVVGGCLLGGLVLCLAVAAVRKLREGYRVRGRVPAFVLFLLLENPGLVYAGVLLGLAIGIHVAFPAVEASWELAAGTVGGGLVLGYVFWLLRHAHAGPARRWLSLALAAALVGAAVAVFLLQPQLFEDQRPMLGAVLLLGIPGFYLLTFASLVEESEVEVAAVCAALGVGLFLASEGRPTAQFVGLAVPVLLYFGYTRFVLRGLRVFKHVLRGISYATVGQNRAALASFSRALQLDPKNRLAREQLWAVHRRMDFREVANDPETLALVSFELCLERVGSLLRQPPSAAQREEAHRLLDLVSQHREQLRPPCDYWRSVALSHERRYDEAAASLESVITARSSPPDSPERRAILLDAWQLALLGHPELGRRVGTPQLAQPGRRMEAIAAVERRLAAQPEDLGAWDLKRLLYSELTEEDYNQAAPPGGAAADFDHTYAYQLGAALVDKPDQWRRGAAYLRLAAQGLPANAPGLLVRIARASEKFGDNRGAWDAYEQAKQAGRAAGPKNLSDEDRRLYFGVVKMLAEAARDEGNLDAATENFNLYTQYDRAGVETYRQLADLYERRGDPWSALRATEQGLVYDPSDADLLQRKDKYYYSVLPGDLRGRWESVAKWFDLDYCLRKARALIERHGSDLDLLDWASHLLDLAQAAKPGNITVRVLRARVRRLRGEISEATALLEEVRANRPESFPSDDEAESWFLACRLLGDMYLEERPELAVECFQEYRKSSKSGADTMYKLGVAYERLGDLARAAKCYRQVLTFESHPLAPEAHDALARLRAPSS